MLQKHDGRGGCMENIVFERDYKEEHKRSAAEEESSTSAAIFDRVMNSNFLKAYSDKMDAIPKVIVPEDKANYEYLLAKCDEMAKHWGGKIRGIVDYQKWDAHIYLTLPFAEFGCDEDLALLKEIAEKSHSVTFSATKDGKVELNIFIYYFEEIADKRAMLETEIMKDNELVALLEKQSKETNAYKAAVIHWFIEYIVKKTGKSREELSPIIMKEVLSDPNDFFPKIEEFKRRCDNENDG
jgi:hypothetical protein